MVTKVILVRHGQSTGNAANCFTGQTDVALSQLGRQQAELTAQLLAHEQFNAIYASDLQRARITAELIAARHQLPVQTTAKLREINLGLFQGQSFTDVAKNYPHEFNALSRRDLDVTAPGGESHRAVRARVIESFCEILSNHAGGQICIVAHGGVIFHINHYIFGIPAEQSFTVSYRIANCSLHRYELLDDQRWRIITLNDDAHVRALNGANTSSPADADYHAVSEKLFGCS